MQTIGKQWESVMQQFTLLSGQSADGFGEPAEINTDRVGFQPSLYGTSGALSATVRLWASVDSKHWYLVASFALAGTVVTAGTAVDTAIESWEAPVPYWKAEVADLVGTGAAVDVSGVAARPTSDVA